MRDLSFWTYIHTAVLFISLGTAACAQQYVSHFSGEISGGQEYRKEIGSGLVFLLKPTDSGWIIGIIPETQCVRNGDWAVVVNPPYRNYNALHLDAEYGITANEAVKINPRKFFFVTSCADFKREWRWLEIVLWPGEFSQRERDEAFAKLGTSPKAKATFTIISSKVVPAEREIAGKNYGKIVWLKFTVDITPPANWRR